MRMIVECNRSDGVKIHNWNDKGDPLSIMIPAELIFNIDYLLREVTVKGIDGAQLTVHWEGIKDINYVAEFGTFRCAGSTPWDAIARLGKTIRDFKQGR